MSPALRNEIDELKKQAVDSETSLKRLKKSVETFKKNNETNVDSLQNNLEQSLESLTSKLSNFESRHQDNVSHLEHLKQSLRNIIGEELKNSKQVRDIETKLSNVREMLLHHDETFGEILESLSLNQLAVSALKEYLTSES
jgi:chromosome segregation ATPase